MQMGEIPMSSISCPAEKQPVQVGVGVRLAFGAGTKLFVCPKLFCFRDTSLAVNFHCSFAHAWGFWQSYAARAVQRSIHEAHCDECVEAAEGDAMPGIGDVMDVVEPYDVGGERA